MKRKKNIFFKARPIPEFVEQRKKNPESKTEKKFSRLYQAYDRVQNIKRQKFELEEYIKIRKKWIRRKNTIKAKESVSMQWDVENPILSEDDAIVDYEPSHHLTLQITGKKLNEFINTRTFLKNCLDAINIELKQATEAFETLYANKNG